MIQNALLLLLNFDINFYGDESIKYYQILEVQKDHLSRNFINFCCSYFFHSVVLGDIRRHHVEVLFGFVV